MIISSSVFLFLGSARGALHDSLVQQLLNVCVKQTVLAPLSLGHPTETFCLRGTANLNNTGLHSMGEASVLTATG